MSSVSKEKKRAADREAQRLNRARTKAYITQLEQTIQNLTGTDPPDNPNQNLAQQQERINNLEDVLRKIGILAQNATNTSLPSSISDHQTVHPSFSSQTATENQWLAGGLGNTLSPTATCNFLGIDLTCSDRERDYLAVLGSAMAMIQDCSFTLSRSIMLISRLHDDNFCIRAVVGGWEDTTDRLGTDVIWELIRAIDDGLYYRADPVTRIALLRIMRSLMLTSIMHQPFLDFFPWPEFRDQWIAESPEYVNELCAASFSARIRFQWPFEVRDVFHREVLTGNLSFSNEFEKRYHELASWRLDPESV
ncbi:unnamed protein product [Penicillium bialowiezense]